MKTYIYIYTNIDRYCMVLLWKQVRRLKPQIFSNDSIKSQRKKNGGISGNHRDFTKGSEGKWRSVGEGRVVTMVSMCQKGWHCHMKLLTYRSSIPPQWPRNAKKLITGKMEHTSMKLVAAKYWNPRFHDVSAGVDPQKWLPTSLTTAVQRSLQPSDAWEWSTAVATLAESLERQPSG